MDDNYRRRLEAQKRREERRKREVFRQKLILGGALAVFLLVAFAFAARGLGKQEVPEAEQEQEKEQKEEVINIKISAAGDCTLGTDEYFDYASGFVAKYKEVNDPAYFFKNVEPIFAEDDLTIVNMEGTLTTEETRQDKRFAFKGDAEYAKILTAGSVEAANFANNHAKDYGEKSYTDTIDAMDAEGITSFGYDRTALMEVNGIQVGLLGTYELDEHMDCEEGMVNNINSLKEQGAQLIIASFHWGVELDHYPNETQIALAHSAIDHGADLVLGHHPHVLQGIERYKGKNIVYSLANFCFGGNSGPNDMDTMIYQQTFTFKDGSLQVDNVTSIIPCKISSAYADGYNNYQPMIVEGDTAQAIQDRIEEYSAPFAPDPSEGLEGEPVT